MEYIIKRKNHIIAQIRPEGQLQTSIMGEELVTMTFSLGQYIRFQTGDSVEVYGNLFYLASEPQVEKISTREFRYSLEFQGVKYELSKVQYLFPDAQNVLNLSEFHIMGTARQMLDLLVQNANRIGAGWSLGNIDTTETKQLHFSAENCLSVLSKIAQEFKLEYWVDANKSIHLTERKSVSGYSFEYGKSKGLVSLTREAQQGSNIVTRLYAFGSEKNIAGNYRNGQKQLRMAVPYLEKNTDIYGIIEGSQTFDVYPHRIGKVTATNPNNPLQFTDSEMDFDLNEKDANGTKYLINGVPLKVTFNTGQLAGYTFEVKEFGYHSATKTFTLLKNQDEKAIEVPSETLRPAVGDSYVLTDLIMPQEYIANAEAELQRKAQAYLNENSRERVMYRLVTDPLYFKEQNVDLQLGSTIFVKDTDFNLEENLRIVRLVKDLQNPYKVQVEVAERAEIAYIVREYLQEEKAKTALLQADKFNANLARKAYLFGREIHDNIFDGEGYFDTDKIKPLSIDTKLISVGSRMQQFALPDVLISIVNEHTIKNTQGKIVHLSLEENPREWHIPANTQTGISTNFNYIYIKAQRNGNNASVLVSSEKIAVESDPNFYHFEAGYLGSVENGNRRIRLSHGFTQISPHEITTGRISSQDGSQYIDLLQDKIKIVADVEFSAENKKEILEGIQIGGRNLILNSSVRKENDNYQIAEYPLSQNNQYINGEEYTITIWGNLNPAKSHFSVYNSGGAVELCRLSKISEGIYTGTFRWGNSVVWRGNTYTANNSSLHIYQVLDTIEAISFIEKIKLEKGNKATDWTPAPEDLQSQIALAETNAKTHTTQEVNNLQIGARNLFKGKIHLNGNDYFKSDNSEVGIIKIQDTNTNWNAYGWIAPTQEVTNKPLSMGMYFKAPVGVNFNVDFYADHSWNFKRKNFVGNGEWQWVKIENITKTDASKGILVGIFGSSPAIANIEYKDFILVTGTKAPENWTPAPEDVTEQITTSETNAKAHATQEVNNLQIGGRNFLKNTQYPEKGQWWVGNCQIAYNQIDVFGKNTAVKMHQFTSIDAWFADFENKFAHLGAGDYVFSGYFKCNRPSYELTFYFDQNKIRKVKNISNQWQRLEIPFKIENVYGEYRTFHIFGWHTTYDFQGLELEFCYLKLEKGTKATDWTPAPEDIDAQILPLKEKTDFFNNTKIKGNFITSQTLEMGNEQGAEAGITGEGLENDAVRFWAGASFENRAKAPFRVLDNGTLHAENAHIKGKIEATSGKIGGFQINSSADTKLIANGLQLESGGLIRSRGSGDNSHSTAFIVNEKNTLNDVLSHSPCLSIHTSAFDQKSHSAASFSSIGANNTALRLRATKTTGTARALHIEEGIITGRHAVLETPYIGQAYWGAIEEHLHLTNTFIFTSAPNHHQSVVLPSESKIRQIVVHSNVSFELRIIVAYNCHQLIRIQGQNGGALVNNDGNWANGQNGYLDLGRGDTLTLRYCDSHYYIMSHRQ